MNDGRYRMKKAKMVFWLLIAAFFGLIVFQNKGYFLDRQDLVINLYFAEYHVPALYNIIYFLFFFVLGLILAYFMGLYERYKQNQVIKNLTRESASRADTIARLETENDSLKSTLAEGSLKPDELKRQPAEEVLLGQTQASTEVLSREDETP